MADEKLTALAELTAPALTDITYVVDDPGGAPLSRKTELGRLLALLALDVVNGRLTLTTGVPVTTSDVTAAATLYFTPVNGNRIALYDGTAWDLYAFSELSIAVPNTSSQMYDVFVYDNAGALALELTAWTNDTTRATALTTQDGVHVRSGATTRRYVGSFRTTTVAGETEDSVAKRYLWNYYNRAVRPMQVLESTNSWTYNVAAWRPANNSTTNRVQFVIGVAASPVQARVEARVSMSPGSAENGHVGIGLDATNANSAQFINDVTMDSATISWGFIADAAYIGIPAVGYHYLQWLEYARNGTPTFYGNAGTAVHQSGMIAVTEG